MLNTPCFKCLSLFVEHCSFNFHHPNWKCLILFNYTHNCRFKHFSLTCVSHLLCAVSYFFQSSNFLATYHLWSTELLQSPFGGVLNVNISKRQEMVENVLLHHLGGRKDVLSYQNIKNSLSLPWLGQNFLSSGNHATGYCTNCPTHVRVFSKHHFHMTRCLWHNVHMCVLERPQASWGYAFESALERMMFTTLVEFKSTLKKICCTKSVCDHTVTYLKSVKASPWTWLKPRGLCEPWEPFGQWWDNVEMSLVRRHT